MILHEDCSDIHEPFSGFINPAGGGRWVGGNQFNFWIVQAGLNQRQGSKGIPLYSIKIMEQKKHDVIKSLR